MKGFSVLVLVASISFIAGAGLTYVAKTPWPSDMGNQASIKPQEGPMLPPQGSVATDLAGGAGASPGNMSGSVAGHQPMGHQHAESGAAGHHHDGGGAKHDHSSKEKAQGMDHQHAKSGAAGHHHDGGGTKHDHGAKEKRQGMGHQHGASDAGSHQREHASAKHDHGTKSVSPTQTKDSHPLPTDLLGSAGTGPGKTIQSPGGQEKAGDKNSGAHDHSPQKAPQAPAKGSQHNPGSHSHADGADHDHGKAAGSPGKQKHSHNSSKAEKNKAKGSATVQQHSQGPAGHSHGAGDGHAHGSDMHASPVVNPIKPTEASIKTGHKLFNIYCAVCHGDEGRGGAPMGNKLAGIPKFTAELLRKVDDAHMFSMVTSGHGPMPGYGEALTPEERWHVSNYVRTLQNKLASEKTASTRQGASR